jgi:UDP-2,4-diacetamido-2,4,6-trideoxy-beta-L-altropyranose hydrolase
MNQTLLIRADASVAMGIGHVMRCLALAQAWQDIGGRAVFAMAETTPAIEKRLLAEHCEIRTISATSGCAEDAAQTVKYALAQQAAWIVVDGYQFGTTYQRALAGPHYRLLWIDDLASTRTYTVDLVLDQNIGVTEELYADRAASTRLLLGHEYCLMRREFARWRNLIKPIPARASKVLVTMGGSDPDNITRRVVDVMTKITDPALEVAIMIGGSSPHPAEVISATECAGPRFRVIRDAVDITPHMAWADLAIIAAGGTIWELLSLGCPTLSFARNDAQANVVAQLQSAGAVKDMGRSQDLDLAKAAQTVQDVMVDATLRQNIACVGRKLVDGRGAARVIAEMNAFEPRSL